MGDMPNVAGGPIFIVGSSRSGTSLLRQILNGHDRIWITGETYYFDDLRPTLRTSGSTRLDPEARERTERFFTRFGNRRWRSARALEELRGEADRLGGSADAYFEAFCRLRARRREREIWGEKTPRHVFRIDEMMAAYPGARIICLVRDPRAVVASYRDAWQRAFFRRRGNPKTHFLRARQQYDIVLTALLWNGTVRASYDARARFGGERVFVQSYESLVMTTEDAVRDLTEWLGVGYQESMLDEVKVVASSYASIHGAQGISAEPLTRWRKTLTPEEIGIVQMITGRLMRELGYEREEVSASVLRLASILAAMPAGIFQALSANRHRLGRALEFGRRRVSPVLVRRPLGGADDQVSSPEPGSSSRSRSASVD